MDVRPGDGFVLKSKGFVPSAIRVLTRSRVNHAGVVVTHAGQTVEATPRGACLGQLGPRHIVFRVPDVDGDRVAAAARGMLHRPYGFLDIAALGLAFFGITIGWVAERISRSDRVICSQLVALAFRAAGRPLFGDGRLPQNVTPGDLEELAAASGWLLGCAGDPVLGLSVGDDRKP